MLNKIKFRLLKIITLIRYIVILGVITIQYSLMAQVSSSYTFTQGAGTLTTLSAYTTHASGTADDLVFSSVSIGFSFIFNGCPYTTVNITCNGYISFGNLDASTRTPLSVGTSSNVISAMGADMQGLSTGSLRSQTTGSSPNRTFTVEWLHYEKYGGADDYSFQIVLYETTNVIEIYYTASTTVNPLSYEVGLRGASSSDFNNRKKSTTQAWTSSNAGTLNTDKMITGNNVSRNPNGKFTWTPPAWSSIPSSCTNDGNVMIFSNYDGSGNTVATRLNIDIDVDIPNLKIGICSYERVTVDIGGAYVGNVTEVIYAGRNDMGHNHCGSVATTVITGVSSAIITYNYNPPVTCPDPLGNNTIICGYQCSVASTGGCNTSDQVVCYFLSEFGAGSVLGLFDAQYSCWNGVTKTISGISSCCNELSTLPIELLYFNASSPDNKTVLAEWSTASEINNDFFTVERSKDAFNYKAIGQIKGAGSSNIKLDYSFVDTYPYTGINYYRLKQTDSDGKYTYSETNSVNLNDAENLGFSIYPNPTSGVITIEGDNIIEIELMNINGQIISKIAVKEKQLDIDLSEQAKGSYLIKIITNKGVGVEKIVVE